MCSAAGNSGGTGDPGKSSGKTEKWHLSLRLVFDLLVAAGVAVPLILGLQQLEQNSQSERKRYTCEVAQGFQNMEHVNATTRLERLSVYILEHGKPNEELWSSLYPGCATELCRENNVVKDINCITTAYWNARFMCQEGFADKEVLSDFFGGNIAELIFNITILEAWNPRMEDVLHEMKEILTPFLYRDTGSQDQTDQAVGE